MHYLEAISDIFIVDHDEPDVMKAQSATHEHFNQVYDQKYFTVKGMSVII